MAIMKKGTNVGLDADFQNVKVGDTIRDKNGKFYEIDKYGHAVPNQGGNAVPLDELGEIHLVLADLTDHGPCVELEQARKIICDNLKGTDPGVPVLPGMWEENERQNEPKILDAIPDRVLALELRRRGYEVKATKMIEL